jgi:hypothetical protein
LNQGLRLRRRRVGAVDAHKLLRQPLVHVPHFDFRPGFGWSVAIAIAWLPATRLSDLAIHPRGTRLAGVLNRTYPLVRYQKCRT